jgi:hypothetical protein
MYAEEMPFDEMTEQLLSLVVRNQLSLIAQLQSEYLAAGGVGREDVENLSNLIFGLGPIMHYRFEPKSNSFSAMKVSEVSEDD